MKRILVFFAGLLLAVTAAASELRDRDVLLTEAGVLYTVDAVHDENVAAGQSKYYLTMTIQDGGERLTAPVPGSLSGGAHSHPALAYDSESDTLFLFWQETLFRGLSSKLLFASYHDGAWSEVTALDSVDWKLRRNLRIAVTRSIETTNADNRRVQIPQVVVHAVWWEETGYGEWARYAMLGIDNGVVTSRDFRYLLDLAGLTVDKTNPLVAATAAEVLRHPAVFASPGRDSVDVIFGDADSSSVHRLRIKPVLDGRVRIPIGVRDRNLRNVSLNVAGDARVEAVVDEESVALYTVGDKAVDYVIYRNGAWSSQRSVALSRDVPAQTVVNALRRMVAAQ